MQAKVTFKNQPQEQLKPFTRENIKEGQWYIIDNCVLVLGIESIIRDEGNPSVIAIDLNGGYWTHYADEVIYKIKPVEVEIIVND